MASGDIKIERFLVLHVGDEAPDFTASTLDGKQIRLKDLRGKVVLLDFWATWCAPCIAQMPKIQQAYEQHAKDGRLIVIGISIDESPSMVEEFLKCRNLPWAQIALGPPERNPVAKAYNVSAVPSTFLIDRDGKIVAKDFRGHALKYHLDKLFADPPTTAQEKPGETLKLSLP
jgi:peroxiredoxin